MMIGIGNIGLSLVAQAAQAIAPSTITQDWTAMSSGSPGPVNLTNNAARAYFQHNGISLVWTGLITGTSATLVSNNDFSNLPNAIQVSIDGGAFAAAPNTGNTYTLFNGAQATRLVTVCVNNGMAQSVYVARTGTVISVTGAPPSVVTPATWVDPLGSSALTACTTSKTALSGTGWTTTFLTASSSDAQSTTTSGSNVPCIRLRTASASLWIYSRFRYAYISTDDSITPVRHDSGLADGLGRIHRVTGLTGTHTYNVWSGSTSQGASALQPFFVGVDSAGLVDVGAKARMVQYGDSISAARDGTTRGECEVFAVAASLGYVGSTSAVSGNTIANLRARIDYDLANRTTDPLNDVAIVAIGRNNSTGMVAQDRTDMQYILSALKAKYRKVLVRGVLRAGDGVTTFPTINNDLQTEVAAAADAKIVYVSCDDVPAYATTDSTHPTDPGYVTLRAPIRAKYASVLA
jgi:GDSL-like Lipase/Acylhydrolase family